MKKVISFMLALVMCLSLCACGGEAAGKQGGGGLSVFPEETQDPIIAEITEQLVGEWCYVKNDREYTILEFNDAGYFNQVPVVANSRGHQVDTILSGTYEVSENLLKATTLDSNGKALGGFECELIYENGELRVIYKNLGLECTKGDWYDYLEEHR